MPIGKFSLVMKVLLSGSRKHTSQDFLIEDTSFVEGPSWLGLDPTLPIYI